MPVQTFVMHMLRHRLAQGGSMQLSFQRREALLSTAALTAAILLSDLSGLPAAAADIKTVCMHDHPAMTAAVNRLQRLINLAAVFSEEECCSTFGTHMEVTKRCSGIRSRSVWEHRH